MIARWLAALAERTRSLVRRERFESELDEELRYHLDASTERWIERGLSAADARRRAMRELGGIERTKEEVRSETGVRLIQDCAQDLRYAVRMLRRAPGFSLVVILTMALCIGANGAVFSVVRSILLRPLPFPESDRLVRIFNSYPEADEPRSGASVAQLFDYDARIDALEGVALWLEQSNTVGSEDGGRHAFALRVTPSFFRVLGAEPLLGRVFGADAAAGGVPRAMIGFDLWQSEFGGATDVVGADIVLDGTPHTVVGVLPPTFRLSTWDAQVFTPLAFDPADSSDEERHADNYLMIGRLAPGATVDAAQDQIDALNRARVAEYSPDLRELVEAAGFTTVVRPYLVDLTAEVRGPLLLLWAGVLVVLIIGAANVTSLVFVRARARSAELATRRALGAGRIRLVRQLVTESTLLAAVAGVLGLLLAGWSLRLLGAFEVYEIPRVDEVVLDGTVVGYTVLTVALLGALAGGVPVLRGGERSLTPHARGSLGGSSLAQRGLVSGQIALAFVLVMCAGLLVASLRNLLAVDPGFEPEGVAVAAVTLPGSRYPDHRARLDVEARLFETLEALPGVRRVAMASQLPFSGSGGRAALVADGAAGAASGPIGLPFFTVASTGYFEVMGIELVAGRGFEPGDGPEGPGVAVIDEALARRYWPGRDPLGRHLWLGGERGAPDEAFRVVGVVESIRQNSLAEDDAVGAIYVPHTQASLQFFRLALDLDGERGSVWPSVQTAVRELDPTLVLFWNDTMAGSLDASLILQRTPMRLLSAFAGLGLFLGVLGVYGVMAWEFGRRRREIGLRMAIGSTAWGIAHLLGREWLAVVGAGVVLGVLASFVSTRVLASLLHGIGPVDPAVLVVTTVTIVGAALLACVAPVRTALRVDPAGTLKEG